MDASANTTSGTISPALAAPASPLSTAMTCASSPAKVICKTRRIVALSSTTRILVGTRVSSAGHGNATASHRTRSAPIRHDLRYVIPSRSVKKIGIVGQPSAATMPSPMLEKPDPHRYRALSKKPPEGPLDLHNLL